MQRACAETRYGNTAVERCKHHDMGSEHTAKLQKLRLALNSAYWSARLLEMQLRVCL